MQNDLNGSAECYSQAVKVCVPTYAIKFPSQQIDNCPN